MLPNHFGTVILVVQAMDENNFTFIAEPITPGLWISVITRDHFGSIGVTDRSKDKNDRKVREYVSTSLIVIRNKNITSRWKETMDK